jgi:hypothetical protein
MIRAIAIVAAVLATSPALARPDARAMTCGELNGLIVREGAVVVTTGTHTYQRFVASWGFCDPWEMLQPVYQSTSDQKRCVVYSVCADRPFDFHDMFD